MCLGQQQCQSFKAWLQKHGHQLRDVSMVAYDRQVFISQLPCQNLQTLCLALVQLDSRDGNPFSQLGAALQSLTIVWAFDDPAKVLYPAHLRVRGASFQLGAVLLATAA